MFDSFDPGSSFDPGYVEKPYASLVADFPGGETYPPDSFRIEWGPLFHRGRLDGTARLLVIGQDPAAQETVVRRILVGEAGQRVQGFLAKLGLTDSYVALNTFLYSVVGTPSGLVNDAHIAEYRERWLAAVFANNSIEGVVTFGRYADRAWHHWAERPAGIAYATATHPTAPSRVPAGQRAEATRELLVSWNNALATLHGRITADRPTGLEPYGDDFGPGELLPIPARDLPPGTPDWMRDGRSWAGRGPGSDDDPARAVLTVTVPAAARQWED